MQDLINAYNLLQTISVKGNDVKVMASVMTLIERAIKDVDKMVQGEINEAHAKAVGEK